MPPKKDKKGEKGKGGKEDAPEVIYYFYGIDKFYFINFQHNMEKFSMRKFLTSK